MVVQRMLERCPARSVEKKQQKLTLWFLQPFNFICILYFLICYLSYIWSHGIRRAFRPFEDIKHIDVLNTRTLTFVYKLFHLVISWWNNWRGFGNAIPCGCSWLFFYNRFWLFPNSASVVVLDMKKLQPQTDREDTTCTKPANKLLKSKIWYV